jgi:hypothetical protein
MTSDLDGPPTGQSGYAAARLRAEYLVQAYPETGQGQYWYASARDLLTLALFISVQEQNIAVSDVDLLALHQRLCDERESTTWLIQRTAQLADELLPGVRESVAVLTTASRTRESTFHLACAVLESHRPELP